MSYRCDITLDELLSDPLIRLVMTRDGFRADDVRHLMQRAKRRKTPNEILELGGQNP
jgi:hypothetical protein